MMAGDQEGVFTEPSVLRRQPNSATLHQATRTSLTTAMYRLMYHPPGPARERTGGEWP